MHVEGIRTLSVGGVWERNAWRSNWQGFRFPSASTGRINFFNAAVHLVESHVKGLGAFTAHVAGEDAIGGCSVGLDRGGRLQVAHLGEGCADRNGLLAVEENCTSFCFRGGSHDGADGLEFGEYCTIRGRSWANVV